MKILFTIIILLCLSVINAKAETGKIGINLINPKSTLHVGGDVRIDIIKENYNPSYFLVTNNKGEVQKLKTDSFATYGTMKISGIARNDNIWLKDHVQKVIFNKVNLNTNELLYEKKYESFIIKKIGFYMFTIQIDIENKQIKVPIKELIYKKNEKDIYNKNNIQFNESGIYLTGASIEHCKPEDRIEFLVILNNEIFVKKINLVITYLGEPPEIK
jgi:hypothetical protein